MTASSSHRGCREYNWNISRRSAGAFGAALRGRAICEAVADGSQGQLSPAGHVQFAEDMIEILLHRAFAEAQIVGDLLIGFGFSDKRHNLLFAERERVAGLLGRRQLRFPACSASVLFAASVKAGPAT